MVVFHDIYISICLSTNHLPPTYVYCSFCFSGGSDQYKNTADISRDITKGADQVKLIKEEDAFGW